MNIAKCAVAAGVLLTSGLATAQGLPPTLSKAFGAPATGVGSTVSLTITVTNPNATPLTGVAFSDTFPAGLVFATPSALAATCGGVAVAATGPPATLSLSGGSLAANSSCTVSANVVPTVAATFNNVAGPVSSAQTGIGAVSNTATLLAAIRPTISKQFGAVAVPLGGGTRLVFTITNPNTATSLTNISVTDVLPSGLRIGTPADVAGSCIPGATVATTNISISVSGLTLAAGASCTLGVNVIGFAEGAQLNTTGPISSTQSGAGGTASATLFVGSALQISYAANLTSGDSMINLTNTGANGSSLFGPGFGGAVGNICVNVYTFSPDEQLVSCCSCLITPNGGASLSVVNDLISNTLTGVRPSSVVVKLLATATGINPNTQEPTFTGTSCSNSAASSLPIASGMEAWRTTLHAAPTAGTYAVTEVPFAPSTLSRGELDSIRNRCTNIIGNGSTFGICRSCRFGTLGAVPALN